MSANSHSNNASVSLLVIRSADMDRSAAFYTALGLNFVKHSHPPCGEHYATTGDACVFEIYPRKVGQRTTTDMYFGLNVPSVDESVKAAVAIGGALLRSPEDSEWGRTATLRDLDGNRVMLNERWPGDEPRCPLLNAQP